MFREALALIILAFSIKEIASFSLTKWQRGHMMGIRSQGAVYMQAKTSISSLKEQFISPDDHLVNKIASWQEDCGYKG